MLLKINQLDYQCSILHDGNQLKFLQEGSNWILSKAQNVTHQSTYFIGVYSFHQVEFKFERISRIQHLLQKLSSKQD